ncbi:MAG: dihydroorotate dehydrogenase electron transfer subunit [Gammaproteobacteria bacterium]|nr:dihydroorotate dehydrogenase electron transfer subunit [Gammaproteobacteria bacterium]
MTHRDTLLVEEAEILSHQAHPGEQYILRLKAPRIAQRARAGSFVHIKCDPRLPMRRPLSIMRADARAGWIELLYRAFGDGTRLLSGHGPGTRLSVLGPIGRPFTLHPERPRALLIGGGVGIPPMIFLVEEMRRSGGYSPLVLMGSEVPFPFTARPSQILAPGMPEGAIAAMPLMDDWGVPSRLASLQGYPGCFHGYVTDLARRWLEALSQAQRDEVEIFACGPHPMLEAAARLARDHALPCQVSLEEFMACAVGGCAGCTVRILTADGPAMKRVCVDGPVFDAATVVF